MINDASLNLYMDGYQRTTAYTGKSNPLPHGVPYVIVSLKQTSIYFIANMGHNNRQSRRCTKK